MATIVINIVAIAQERVGRLMGIHAIRLDHERAFAYCNESRVIAGAECGPRSVPKHRFRTTTGKSGRIVCRNMHGQGTFNERVIGFKQQVQQHPLAFGQHHHHRIVLLSRPLLALSTRSRHDYETHQVSA